MDIRDLDRRAIESTGGIIDKLTDDELNLPTPCDKWTVRDLIGHLVDNNHRMIARVTGERLVSDGDPRRAYRDSAAALTEAFRDDAALAVPFEMPVINREVAGQVALTVHFADVLVHGWDLARAIGVDLALDPELVRAAVKTVSQYPDNETIWADGGTIFAPRVPVDTDAGAQEQLLAMTGRTAAWVAA